MAIQEHQEYGPERNASESIRHIPLHPIGPIGSKVSFCADANEGAAESNDSRTDACRQDVEKRTMKTVEPGRIDKEIFDR